MLHWAFDTMVGICSALIALGLWLGIAWWRKRDIPQTKWFLRAVAVSGVAAVVALECGWIVTEVGRQPWIVYNVMRTEDAVTQASGVYVTFAAVIALYAVLGAALVVTLRAMARRWRAADEVDVPYGPAPPPALSEVPR
jgi:cytochrome d ubiquinol oxidase subunit I